ncbi:MAG: hypothetical protein ACXWL2_02380 [Candidatus Chromulinivorax sp.]
MKKYIFFTIWLTLTINITALEDQSQAFKELKDSCTINIHRIKLEAANKKTLTQEDFQNTALLLEKIYNQCESIINDQINYPNQPILPKEIWINKSLGEINLLQHDTQTRDCFNVAITEINKIDPAQSEEEKQLIIKKFYEINQNCHTQHALKISVPHLKAQIERWQNNPQQCQCDIASFTLFAKHGQELQADFQTDVKKLYDQCNIPTTFDNFTSEIENSLKKIKNDKKAQQCLHDLIMFKKNYDAVKTDEEKDLLINNFAITYLECKNR